MKMKRWLCTALALMMLVLLCACGDSADGTQGGAWQKDSSRVVSLTDDVEEIALYDPDAGEEHTLSDRGMTLKNAGNLQKDAAAFVESGGILYNYLFTDATGVSVSGSQFTDTDYAITLCLMRWNDEEDTVPRSEAHEVLASYYGKAPDHTLSAPLLLTYSQTADGYTLTQPVTEGEWKISFAQADYLGNGFLRMNGKAVYRDHEGSSLSYALTALLTRGDESGFGFSLRGFTLKAEG